MTHITHRTLTISNELSTQNLNNRCTLFEYLCDFASMASMSFDHGGRRCIRPILEKYQSGKC